MIDAQTRADIRRLFFAEHFTVNAIAEAVGVHHDTVRRAIEADRFVSTPRVVKSRLDPYLPFLIDTLDRYPRIRSTRLLLMLRDRGYTGSVQQLRRVVRRHRPRKDKAFLALTFLPAEQVQVDWGDFGTLQVGRAVRRLSCFVMTLSYSRRMYARFTLDQTLATFLACHVQAFRDFGGVPRVALYDNLKSAVLERVGDAIRFHPALLELAGHFHFRPVAANVAAGWEKGRVESSIRYLRSSYAEARHYRDLSDANAQLRRFLDEVANVRSWVQDRTRTVDEAFREERPRLLPLPEHAPNTSHVQVARSGKQPYVRFDLNDYSIPHRLVHRPLTLVADEHLVRVIDGKDVVARHGRTYDRGARVEDPAHFADLLAERKKAIVPKAQDRLRAALPQVDKLFDLLALRGENLGNNVAHLVRLLETHDTDDVREAVREALERQTPRATSVASILDRRLAARRLPPAVTVQLPDDPRVRNLRVVSHDPATYDGLLDRPKETQ
jgi:transposase